MQNVGVEVVVHTKLGDMRLQLVMTRSAQDKDFSVVVPTVVALGVDVMPRENTHEVTTRTVPFMFRHHLPPSSVDGSVTVG
jgi:hypothetical protein